MKSQKQLRFLLLFAIAIVISFFAWQFGYKPLIRFLFGSSHATGLGYRRVINIVNIRTALMQYKQRNGHYPKRLSDLFPNYIKNIEILYGPGIGINNDWEKKHRSFVNAEKHFDKNFAYFYFGDNTDMTLCEKPGIWKKDKQIAPDILCILFPDGSVKVCNLLKRKELGLEAMLQERLNQFNSSDTNDATDKKEGEIY